MLHFENDEAKLDLAVVSYELADPFQSESDERNWLTLRATYQEEDVLVKDSNCCLLTYELKELTAGLKVLGAGLKERYDSDFSEPFFLLQAWQEGDGFGMDVSFALPNTMSEVDVADLRVSMTKQELQRLITQLDLYCEKFPER